MSGQAVYTVLSSHQYLAFWANATFCCSPTDKLEDTWSLSQQCQLQRH